MPRSGHAVPPQDVVAALSWALGEWWGAGYDLKLILPTGREERAKQAAGARRTLWERMQLLDEQLGAQIMCSPGRKNGESAIASCLWVRISSNDQRAKLRALRPLPAIVLEEEAQLVAFWPLTRYVDHPRIVRANKRIAYRVGAVQKHADPDQFWFTLPGSVIRLTPKGDVRKRAGVCRVLRCTDETFTVKQVVGRLKDPPEPKWREKQDG